MTFQILSPHGHHAKMAQHKLNTLLPTTSDPDCVSVILCPLSWYPNPGVVTGGYLPSASDGIKARPSREKMATYRYNKCVCMCQNNTGGSWDFGVYEMVNLDSHAKGEWGSLGGC